MTELRSGGHHYERIDASQKCELTVVEVDFVKPAEPPQLSLATRSRFPAPFPVPRLFLLRPSPESQRDAGANAPVSPALGV